ncbi:MAG TPA: hypothetical protein VIY47_04075 [Ignavibacteriaceae bacterium]
MRQKAIYVFLIVISVSLLSCSDNPINTITVENWASNDVSVNFRGSLTDVPAGATVELTNILQGEYEYETIYVIPSGASSFEASESCAGTLVLSAGTKVLIIYTSVFIDEKYSISASITSSNNLSEDGILPNPIGP